MGSTKAQIKASMRYNANNTTVVRMALNNKTDADIIQKLTEVGNKQGYIKELIRKDISK